MYQFNELWVLFRRHGSSNKREAECAQLWESYSPEMRDVLYETIRKKLDQRKFVHYDPLRAMQENVERIRSQTLSYNAYYDRYHTTEERDGWKMVTPQKAGDPPVYYAKVGWDPTLINEKREGLDRVVLGTMSGRGPVMVAFWSGKNQVREWEK